MYETPGAASEGTYTPDNLIASEATLRAQNVTIAEGQNLARGAVLGKRGNAYDDTVEFVLSVRAAADGSQTPIAILALATDATAGDVAGVPAYFMGDFNERALTFGAGHDADTVRDAFRGTPIFIQPSVAA